MARTINPFDNQEVELEENEELVSLSEEEEKPTEEPEQKANETETEEEAKSEDDDIPEKYKGKSVKELARMHQEVEKLVGRQSSEVGELRKSVDDLLKVKLNEDASSPNKKEEPELDFYEDPKGSVSKAVENSDTIIQMKEMLAKQQEQGVLKQIGDKHPDYEEIIKNENFVNFRAGNVQAFTVTEGQTVTFSGQSQEDRNRDSNVSLDHTFFYTGRNNKIGDQFLLGIFL